MKKTNDFQIDRGWLFGFKQDFQQRFNIDLHDDCFIQRCIQLCAEMIENGTNIDEVSNKVFLVIGKVYTKKYIGKSLNEIISYLNKKTEDFDFKQTDLCILMESYLHKDTILPFLQILEIIINFYYKEKNKEILNNFNDIAYISNKPIRLTFDNCYKFYPSGVEILDKKLIDDVLDFLKQYPTAHKEFSESLRIFLEKKSYRDCIDKSRLALEIFLKEFFNNKKSLENQVNCIGTYFEEKNINKEIANLFNKLLNTYKSLQNDKAKHNSGTFNEAEVEFLFYLVGSFMRLFIQINQTKISQ